jgi:heme A synthase
MYTLVLSLHSWLRWGVIAAALLATGSTFASRPAGSPDPADRWGLIFMISLDLQMLLGLLLYFALSPTTAAIMKDFGGSMKDPVARFWAVEHICTMILAVVLAHVGRVLARKATTPASKRTRLMVCFTLSTILILAGTPWPGMTAGRPLFRV